MEYSHAHFDELFAGIGPVVIIALALFILFITLIVLVIRAVIYCKIFSKAGYHWTFGLLMLVPIVCIIMPFVLAFGDWPIYRELRQLRQQSKVMTS